MATSQMYSDSSDEEYFTCEEFTEDETNDSRNKSIYDDQQNKIVNIYKSIDCLVLDKPFNTFFKRRTNMEKLAANSNDIMKRDCPVVIVGETSSGKSTLINMIIGKDILPIQVTASTTRVCIIRDSKEYSVSTKNKGGTNLETLKFQNKEDLKNSLERLAVTTDSDIFYVDVRLPVGIIKGNVTIVDTPGVGDIEQEPMAQMMMNYVKNALAVVFVVNVANAGGIQSDRISRIIKHIKESMTEMVCFTPDETIFVLNKWDSVLEPQREGFFEHAKRKIHEIWEEINDEYILKLSAGLAHREEMYKIMFDEFNSILKAVVSKNESKRINIHLKFLKQFLEELNKVASEEKPAATQRRNRVIEQYEQEKEGIQESRQKIQQTDDNLPEKIEHFLSEATDELYLHLRSADFRNEIINGAEDWTRVGIQAELRLRIDNGMFAWQRRRIGNIYWKTILKDLHETLHSQSLNNIVNKINGRKAAHIFNKMLAIALAASFGAGGPALMGGLAVSRFLVNPPLAIGLTVAGVIAGVAVTRVRMAILDFGDIRDKSFEAEVNALDKTIIKKTFRSGFVPAIKNEIPTILRKMEQELQSRGKENERKQNEGKEEYKEFQLLCGSFCKLNDSLNKILDEWQKVG